MLQEDKQVLADTLKWLDRGQRVWLVTVVRTWGVSPRPVGSWAALHQDGLISGSVSGGCIEDDLAHRMKTGDLHRDAPFFLEYGIDADEAHRFGLPCGGTLKLLVEPAADHEKLRQLAALLDSGQVVAREVDTLTGAVMLRSAQAGEESRLAGSRFTAIRGPRWRLLIVGAGQIARYLAPMAQAVGFAVTVSDPRFEAEAAWSAEIAPMVRDMPDDFLARWRPDAHSAIVAVAHDPKIDDMALLEALKSPAFFVGVIGSQATQQKRRDRLRMFDLDERHISRLRGPVGIPIGSRTPPEIAVSIVADLVAARNRRPNAGQAAAADPNPFIQQHAHA
jgi:xanthine dehydrogenase accessory factor